VVVWTLTVKTMFVRGYSALLETFRWTSTALSDVGQADATMTRTLLFGNA